MTDNITWVTIPEAARKGLINESALRTLVKTHVIPAIMVGTRAYINYDEAHDILLRLSTSKEIVHENIYLERR